MIRLEAESMTAAIEKARIRHPKVRVINADERIYAVYGSRGDAYTVKFVVIGGNKLAECDCPARGLCYHIAAAASVNIAVQSMRQPPRIERTVERDHRGNRYNVVRCDNWKI